MEPGAGDEEHELSRDQVTTLQAAVAEHIQDGMTISLEGFGHLIPFAAGHEIIRQGRTGLTLVRMTPDLVTDMLLAAGCVERLVCSFFASGSAGSLHELRRRLEHHDPAPLDIEEYSHFGMICRYEAGAAGLPFYPMRSYVGSDLPAVNPQIRTVASPYGEGEVYVVPPVNPDVTVIHAQRADREGNVQMWGILGVQQQAAYAARSTIVTVEEIVDNSVIRADPNRTIIPAHAVSAVVEVPRGAHPSYAQGYYDRDNTFIRDWIPISKDAKALRAWLQDWVYDLPDHAAYVARLGEQRWDSLAVASRPSGVVDYGRRLA